MENHETVTMSSPTSRPTQRRNRCGGLLSEGGVDSLLQGQAVVLSTEHEQGYGGALQETYLIKGPSAAPRHAVRLRKLGLVSKRPGV